MFVMMIEGDSLFLMLPRQEGPVEGQLAIIFQDLVGGFVRMENGLLQQFLVQQVINRLEIILTRLDMPIGYFLPTDGQPKLCAKGALGTGALIILSLRFFWLHA